MPNSENNPDDFDKSVEQLKETSKAVLRAMEKDIDIEKCLNSDNPKKLGEECHQLRKQLDKTRDNAMRVLEREMEVGKAFIIKKKDSKELEKTVAQLKESARALLEAFKNDVDIEECLNAPNVKKLSPQCQELRRQLQMTKHQVITVIEQEIDGEKVLIVKKS